MKTNIKRPFLLTALSLSAVAAAMLAASPARAQNGAVAVPEENKDITVQDGRLKLGRNPTVAATLNHAVAALRQLYPDVNIVMEPGVGEIAIGDIVLRPTEPDLDLEALSIASGKKFNFRKDFSQPAPGFQGSSRALLVIQANKPPPVAKPEKQVAAFNLSAYFGLKNLDTTADWKDTKKQEEIKGHVEKLRQILADTIEALHPKGEGFAAVMRGEPLRRIDFYPDANLLVVIGSQEDLEAARVVIGALPGMEATRSSFQQNLRRIRGEQGAAEGMAPAPPAALAPRAAPVPPQTPVLPEAPVPPQNPPQ